jgi:hypothetical protein
MWRFRRRPTGEQVSREVEEARRERQLSERRLDETQVQLIVPLSALRRENHITELVQNRLRKLKGDAED